MRRTGKILARTFVWAISTACAVAAHSEGAYPNKPIRFVVGFAAGGSADVVARAVGQELSRVMGQPVIIDNRPGASAHIATQAVLTAPADGYTMLLAGLSLATNPAMMKSVGYDPKNDLTMVSQMTAIPVVVFVPGDSPLNSLNDLVAASRSKPGGLNFGSGGTGTSSHLGPELLSRTLGFKYTHVPYRGGAPALQGMLSSETDVMYDIGVSPLLRSTAEAKKIKFIGVMQKDAIPGYPSIRSAGQQGIAPATYMRSWQGVAVRAGTPPEIVAKLYAGIQASLSKKDVRERLAGAGVEIQPSASPQEFQKLYLDELARWSSLIQAAGIKLD